jgi:hypothetical protein
MGCDRHELHGENVVVTVRLFNEHIGSETSNKRYSSKTKVTCKPRRLL